MVQTVSDRRFDTKFVSEKLKKYKTNAASSDKSNVHFNLAVLEDVMPGSMVADVVAILGSVDLVIPEIDR